MIAFPGMLLGPAHEAGIKTPPDNVVDDDNKFDPQEYPHWMVFCNLQLGSSMPTPTAHWENAKVIAAIPEDKIRTMTYQDIMELGFQIGNSTP